MVTIKPFKGIRPPAEIAAQVCSRPYDVLNSEEARKEAQGNEKSLYHIIKPEIDFPVGKDEHDEDVYLKAKENFALFQQKGWLKQDEGDNLYIYSQTMNGRTQYGLVAASAVDDYVTGVIKKHELTRRDKEEDRMKHVRVTNANVEPVFFAYRKNNTISGIISTYVQENKPEYDFVAEDGIGHTLWVIKDSNTIKQLVDTFKTQVEAMYVADGHHRTAAAALVGKEKKDQNPNHTGNEEYNYFLSVLFSDDQLQIIDYNRVVKDLNGHSSDEFLKLLAADFHIEKKGQKPYRPEQRHNFGLYLDNHWYSLTAKGGVFEEGDPLGSLDVSISSNLILNKLLGIKDLRSDKRVDFVGGIRGLEALEQRVNSGEMKLALALYPVSMEELFTISDTDNIMPPKTTWFEPKLRSGLVIHEL